MNYSVAEPQANLPQPVQSWVISLLFHAVAIWMAAVVLGDLKFVPKEEPFRWDVAMVEPPKPEPVAEPSPVNPTAAKPAPVKPTPVPMTPAEVAPVVETMVTQVVHTIQPVHRVETRELREEVREVRPVEQVVERTVQTITRSAEAVAPAPPAPHMVAHSTTVSTAAPIVEAPHAEAVVQSSQPVVNTAPAPMVVPKSIEAATASVREVVEPKVMAAPPAPAPIEAPPTQVAAVPAAPVVPKLAVKADYRWVGEALGERIQQLMRYPAKARLNNWEGRVMVKIVIREDGHLHDLEIVKGSGHPILDEDALEMIRRACPLKMKHALGRPQITITMPVVYELRG